MNGIKWKSFRWHRNVWWAHKHKNNNNIIIDTQQYIPFFMSIPRRTRKGTRPSSTQHNVQDLSSILPSSSRRRPSTHTYRERKGPEGTNSGNYATRPPVLIPIVLFVLPFFYLWTSENPIQLKMPSGGQAARKCQGFCLDG